MTLATIVEGHGEVAALPIVLRRLLDVAECWDVAVDRPIRRPRSRLIREEALQQAVRLATFRPECSGILVVFDADQDCPKKLAAQLAAWAASASGARPVEIILPKCEFEAWFLASLESLRGKRGIRQDAISPPDPELKRGCKEEVTRSMETGRRYLETLDQPKLAAEFDMAAAHRRSRSFRKLVSAVGTMLNALGKLPPVWPPENWLSN